jgi:ABC-2 type transport system ATP-binding protein
VANPAIEASDLTVRYGDLTAVDGVELAVRPGEVVALLGPNGAGKTTCVETLLGYRRPDEGIARVLGRDPAAEHRDVVGRIGAMLQDGGVWPSLPAREALELFASYYERPEDPQDLLELLDLTRCARSPWRRLSGGERQRLSLAIALLPRPEALFLDEPTAGVDPVGRRVIRDVVAEARSRGVAVLVCTHDLADVESVCDAAVILHEGRVRAVGTVVALTEGGTSFASVAGLDVVALAAVLAAPVIEGPEGTYRVEQVLDAAATSALAAHLGALGAPIHSLHHGTSLEERYLDIVGHAAAIDRASTVCEGRRHRR